MRDFIEFLRNISNDLEDRISELYTGYSIEDYTILSNQLASFIDNSSVEINELLFDDVIDSYLETDISEEEKENIDFIREFCIEEPGLFELEDEQKNTIKNVIEYIKTIQQRIINDSNYKIQKDEVDLLIGKLENDVIFDVESFDLLDKYLVKYDKEKIDKIKIISELCIRNNKLNTQTNNNEFNNTNNSDDLFDESGELKEEEIDEDEKIIKENAIRELLSEFEYNYDDLTEKNKTDLIKYGRIELMRSILEKLKEKGIYFDLSDKNKRFLKTFPMILLKSSPDKIEKVIYAIINKLKSDDYVNIITNNPTLLYGTNIDSTNNMVGRSTGSPYFSGAYLNFINNTNFLSDQGVDLSYVVNDNTSFSILKVNYKRIRTNFMLLKETYNIDPAKKIELPNNKTKNFPLTSLVLHSIFTIERFIEISPYGYELCKVNPSYIGSLSERQIAGIKAYSLSESPITATRTGRPKLLDSAVNKTAPKGLLFNDKESMIVLSGGKKIPHYPITIDALMKHELDMIENDPDKRYGLALDNRMIKRLDEKYLSRNEKINYSKNLGENEDNSLCTTYEFNDGTNMVRISRLKVLRIMDYLISNSINPTLKMLEFAVTYGSYLTREELTCINVVMREEFLPDYEIFKLNFDLVNNGGIGFNG